MNPPQVPPQLRIWQLVLGFANTAVLYALIKTGVIEQLREKPRSAPELAQACGLNAGVLARTLRFATVIDVVTQDEEQYALTEVGRLLLKDVPGSLRLGPSMAIEGWQRQWGNLTHAVTTGENATESAFGVTTWEYFDQHPEVAALFNQWMTGLTAMTSRAVVQAYDFTSFGTVCDVGGGQGILLKSILAANPHLRGILFDLERGTKNHLLADQAQRVQIETGSFFERVPAADVLLLKNVLHDWSDEKCLVILDRCRQAMQPSSRLLIIEMVMTSPADLISVFFDMQMQVSSAGKERTEDEFNSLLQTAGMKLNRIIPTESPVKIIEASL